MPEWGFDPNSATIPSLTTIPHCLHYASTNYTHSKHYPLADTVLLANILLLPTLPDKNQNGDHSPTLRCSASDGRGWGDTLPLTEAFYVHIFCKEKRGHSFTLLYATTGQWQF